MRMIQDVLHGCVWILIAVLLGCSVREPEMSIASGNNHLGNVTNGTGSLEPAQTNQWGGWKIRQMRLPVNDEVRRIVFFDSAVGFVFTASSLFRTFNSGETWTPAAMPRGFSVNDVTFRSRENGLAVGYSSPLEATQVLQTHDGGMTWKPLRSVPHGLFLRVGISSDGVIWVVGRKQSGQPRSDTVNWILRWRPEESEWVDLSDKVNVLAEDERGWIADYITTLEVVGTQVTVGSLKGRVYQSIDGGANWTRSMRPFSDFDQTGMRDMQTLDSAVFWIAGGANSSEGNWTVVGISDNNGGWQRFRLAGYYLSHFTLRSKTEVVGVGVRPGKGNFGGQSERDEGVIMQSVDQGRTWGLVSTSNVTKKYTAVFSQSNERVYVGGVDGSLVVLDRSE